MRANGPQFGVGPPHQIEKVANACIQHGGCERLGDKVRGAEVKGALFITRVREPRDKHDWNVFKGRVRFEGRAHRKSIDARHVCIEKYEVRVDPSSELQRVFAGLGKIELAHIRQRVPQDQNGSIVIVDNQKSRRLPAGLP
jgi:hypothetical protein